MLHKVSALRTGVLSAALLASAAIATPAAAEGEVNIYSYRQPFLIEPLLEAFTKETGIKTNVIFAADGLAERIQAEGANSPADVLLTVDIGRLDGAKEAGITQPVTSEVVNENVPAEFRDPEGHWIGLTTRARIIYASKERVAQDSITYEELADPKWKGKICTRSGQHVYNVALFASIVAHKGAEEAETWLAGVRDNLARKPDRQRPQPGPGDLRRRMRHLARQHLLHGCDAEQREGAGAEGLGQLGQDPVPEHRRSRHPRQHLGRRGWPSMLRTRKLPSS